MLRLNFAKKSKNVFKKITFPKLFLIPIFTKSDDFPEQLTNKLSKFFSGARTVLSAQPAAPTQTEPYNFWKERNSVPAWRSGCALVLHFEGAGSIPLGNHRFSTPLFCHFFRLFAILSIYFSSTRHEIEISRYNMAIVYRPSDTDLSLNPK